MDNLELRSILLNVHRRLSAHDRQCLHFYFKNVVPRYIADDSTLNGTLKLFDSLFDQAKITERNLTILINAFKKIPRFDIVQLLESTSTQNTKSIINQLFEDQEIDTGPMKNIDFENQLIPPSPRRNRSFCTSLLGNKYLILMSLLFNMMFILNNFMDLI